MDNTSILDQIIDNQKAEDVENLNAVEIINSLFSQLSDRERDVLIRRHGLHSGKKETLESIGNAHELTRERIRQIETTSVKKLQKLDNLSEFVSSLRKVIYQLLEEHGGITEKSYLLDLLTGFSLEGFNSKTKDESVHKNYLNFLITKLLHDEFEEVNSSKHFKSFYKLKFQDLEHLEELAEVLVDLVDKKEKIQKTINIIQNFIEHDTYTKHSEKINISSNLDIAKVIKNDFFDEDSNVVNDNKVLYSLLKAVKKVEQNKFGYWGAYNSREIKPKTINDKIYLILQNNQKPLHFVDIAQNINKIRFDKKNANPATVHNELILDDKYVLVGRGLYGLKEWGYKRGTVADVIEFILKDNENPLTKDEIIDRVLEKRLVKKATIILALMNKEKFNREDNRYTLANAIES